MINIIYYSKDRAMQLDASLRSLKKHFKEYDTASKHVIFDASSATYVDTYRTLTETYPEVNFIFQDGFKKNTLECLDTKNWFSMFVMDDIFFKEDFSMSDPIFGILPGNKDVLSLSLRLGTRIKYCYAIDSFMKQPKFARTTDEYLVWKYPGCEGDWGYPMSLDANVYQTDYIKTLINGLKFYNPNELEAVLNQPRVGPKYLACYPKSKLFNVPANRVQNTFENRHENSWSAEDLNKMFKAGRRVDIKGMHGLDNDAVHFPVDFEFEGGD